MSEIQNLPKRNEVPRELTWDLTTIYKNHSEFEKSYDEVKKQVHDVSRLKGRLGQNAEQLLSVITKVLNLNRKYEKLYVYAQSASDVDTTNNDLQSDMDRVEKLGSDVGQAQSWLEPEIIALGSDKIRQFTQDNPALKEYGRFFDEILVNKDHVLPEDQEKLLAGAATIFESPEKTFGILDSSDLKFPEVDDGSGKKVRLSNGIYSLLLESQNPTVRKNTFKAFYSTFDQFQNTLASTLSSEVAVHNFEAQTRKYNSAREMAMSENEIPEVVYRTLIQSVHEHLPLLHRYVALRKKILNVPELHMYDMYVPLSGKPSLKYTFDQAKEEALKALSVYGPDYLQHVKEEFNNRWIDVVENKGKRTGAYSSGMYDTNPFVLLNWQDNLDNLYTLVHETGHSMHSYYSSHNQPYQYGDYSIFVAEIASTTNENILTDYLLKNNSDPEVIKYILNSYLDGVKGTIFRQTQFAEFEEFIHASEQSGKSLTADFMNKYYLKLNQKYYGDDVVSDPEIRLEWSRIPHFYYDFYVYQYATGFAAASALADRITSGDPEKVAAYLNYLKSGSSKDPISIMKAAGVDMTKPDYLNQAFDKFERRLNELEKML
ncbi:oligoendopeptidase F [Fructilactobacillus fructivorans]|uniref:Oligopeptidase F n=1 Tax=Fructilactobacillus fructivorans TaxID=1614 RepID=A0AAE6TWH2_9LACO|nr:oligoendopeptidase F [Fructilactobacillus fructivorans]KRK58842.1 oligoendopeptidase F [Fructilactobacillus fructivorans]QFX92834.1 oligoendopeptidase F [Fructilactobacillus fructivorans]RDV65574.1 oligoendopeptidase F [Fructilactobacillus fructivorans]